MNQTISNIEKKHSQLFVITHKEYVFPDNSDYSAIQSGSALYPSLGYLADNVGENISSKNAEYNELDCLFWVWKNLKLEIVGFNHYRRYFKGNIKTSFGNVISINQAKSILLKNDIIVFKKKHLLMSNYSYYVNCIKKITPLLKNDFSVLKDVIHRVHPDYDESLNIVLKRKYCYFKNSFITTWPFFDEYCSFLFSTLFEFEKMIIPRPRVCGSMGEYLLNVFIEKKHLKIYECKMVRLEKPNYLIMIKNRMFKK